MIFWRRKNIALYYIMVLDQGNVSISAADALGPGHKEANAFIKRYNKEVAFRGYSKLTLAAKNARIEAHVLKVGGAIQADWKRTKRDYHTRMFKDRGVASAKYKKAQTEKALKSLPKVPKVGAQPRTSARKSKATPKRLLPLRRRLEIRESQAEGRASRSKQKAPPTKKKGRRPIAGNDDVFNARRGGLE